MCHEAGQSAFLHTQLYLSTNFDHILLATFLGTNSLSVLMCRKAVNQSINQSVLTRSVIEWELWRTVGDYCLKNVRSLVQRDLKSYVWLLLWSVMSAMLRGKIYLLPSCTVLINTWQSSTNTHTHTHVHTLKMLVATSSMLVGWPPIKTIRAYK